MLSVICNNLVPTLLENLIKGEQCHWQIITCTAVMGSQETTHARCCLKCRAHFFLTPNMHKALWGLSVGSIFLFSSVITTALQLRHRILASSLQYEQCGDWLALRRKKSLQHNWYMDAEKELTHTTYDSDARHYCTMRGLCDIGGCDVAYRIVVVNVFVPSVRFAPNWASSHTCMFSCVLKKKNKNQGNFPSPCEGSVQRLLVSGSSNSLKL